MHSERLARAKELVATVRHIALSTVNEDGSPHCSPVFAAFDADLNVYWASSPDAMHSRNIARSGQVFIVLFDSMEKGGGLYLAAQAEVLEGDNVVRALAIYNRARQRLLREAVSLESLTHGPQRLYRAVPERRWVNVSTQNEQGITVKDERVEITSSDLQSATLDADK